MLVEYQWQYPSLAFKSKGSFWFQILGLPHSGRFHTVPVRWPNEWTALSITVGIFVQATSQKTDPFPKPLFCCYRRRHLQQLHVFCFVGASAKSRVHGIKCLLFRIRSPKMCGGKGTMVCTVGSGQKSIIGVAFDVLLLFVGGGCSCLSSRKLPCDETSLRRKDSQNCAILPLIYDVCSRSSSLDRVQVDGTVL